MGGHRASGGSEGDLVDGPVDLAAVRADDALIDALAGGAGPDLDGYGFGGADDDRLAAILAAWRADIEADPMPELVSLDEAADAVAAGHESRDRLRSRARRRSHTNMQYKARLPSRSSTYILLFSNAR